MSFWYSYVSIIEIKYHLENYCWYHLMGKCVPVFMVLYNVILDKYVSIISVAVYNTKWKSKVNYEVLICKSTEILKDYI